jgi:hypothetical protein
MNNRLNVLKVAFDKGYKTSNGRINDLNFYKKEVNLVSFAEYLGYSVNTQKTGKSLSYNYRYVRMDFYDEKDKVNGAPVKGAIPSDRIMIFKNDKDSFCFKATDGADMKSNGSAIDLVQRRYNCSFGESIKALDKFIAENGLGDSELKLNPISVQLGDLDREIKSFNNISSLKPESVKYLSETRQISPDTLNSPLFQEQILSSERKYSSSASPSFNVAFPLRGLKSLEYFVQNEDNSFAQAFDVRNNNFKSTENVSLGSFWRSNFNPNSKIDTIFVGESPIDCISHYEINKDALQGKNIMYMASAGSLQASQIEILSIPFSNPDKRLSSISADNLVTIFDNDLSGSRYTAQIIANFDRKVFGQEKGGVLSDEGVSILPSVKPKDNTASILLVREGRKADNLLFADKLSTSINLLNANVPYSSQLNENRFKCAVSNLSENKVFVEVSFHNSSNNFQIFNDFMIKEKFGNSMRFKQDVPLTKDYNNDLKLMKSQNLEDENKLNKLQEKKSKLKAVSTKILLGKFSLQRNSGMTMR